MSLRRRVAGSLWIALAIVVAACSPGSAANPSPSASASPAGDATLVGPTWTAISIGGTDTVPASAPTMAFGADGQVQGTGGCNQYGGPYKVDGSAIEIGQLASTMMLCADASVGNQETAFFAAMDGAQTWQIDAAGELHLTGLTEIVARQVVAAPSASGEAGGLVGAWDLAEMGPTADFARIQPTIEFTADGSVSGFAGCNSYSGSYTTDGSTLTFGPLMTTKMACQAPGATVEGAYLAALSGVTGWAVEADGRLLLDGAVPLRYTRH